jgi:hypothetical protein
VSLAIVVLPIKTVSAANKREHWAVRAKRTKAERNVAFLMTPHMELPVDVTLTRVSPRELDDDNLRPALKAIRDGVADRLGVNDRDPQVRWSYRQEKGPAEVWIHLRERFASSTN